MYDAAKQVDWDGYNAETAVVDAIVMQTKSTKLQQKAIQNNPTYEELVKLGISQEQAKRKADALPDVESETTRALQLEVRRLTDKLGKLGAQHQGHEGNVFSAGARVVRNVLLKLKVATGAENLGTSVKALFVRKRTNE